MLTTRRLSTRAHARVCVWSAARERDAPAAFADWAANRRTAAGMPCTSCGSETVTSHAAHASTTLLEKREPSDASSTLAHTHAMTA